MNNHLLAFADAARRFEKWAKNPQGNEISCAVEAITRLLALYSLALSLHPLPECDETEDDSVSVTQEEWQLVFKAAGKLPINYYSEVFNPLAVPPEEPTVGDLADDIADIYRDVIEGLRLYDSGNQLQAHWQWVFSHNSHWGEHATSAIRALHAYLSHNNWLQA